MQPKKRMLFIGDCAVNTGFAKSAHAYLTALEPDYDITVLALGYVGDSHEVQRQPWKLYSAGAGGDMLGLGRVKDMLERSKPHVVVVQNDPWNFPHYLQRIGSAAPVVGIVAVDGKNCAGTKMNSAGPRAVAPGLSGGAQGGRWPGLQGAIFWTKFAEAEARAGGYTGHTDVVPLGVDLDVFRPVDRAAQRAQWGLDKVLAQNNLPPDTFIVGYVGRNQHRKRLDLLVEYFAEWTKTYNRKDAALWIQRAPTGEQAFDIEQLAKYHGIASQLLLPGVANDNSGLSEQLLANVYSVFDIMATTTMGEGWGLPQMEGMACGIPQVVPMWSALEEWTAGAAVQVPCTTYAATPNGPNTIGGIADRREFCAALERLYYDEDLRRQKRDAGLQLVARPEFRWEQVGADMAAAIGRALAAKPLQAVTA